MSEFQNIENINNGDVADNRRDDITLKSASYRNARDIPVIRRRDALKQGTPGMEDVEALEEISKSSLLTKRAMVGNLYKNLPDYDIKNSNCKGLQYVRPSQGNFFHTRFKRWLDEDYYIIEVSSIYKIITMLNVILIICVMVLSYRMWSNNTHLEVVSNDGGEVSKELKIFKIIVNDWLNPIIGATVFLYSTWRVLKRTTGECKVNNYKVNASG